MSIKKISILLASVIFFYSSKGQKKFSAKVIFPSSIDMKNIQIDYYDGFKIKPTTLDISRRNILIQGKYYSKYPMVIITFNTFQKKYLVKNNASIIFYNNSMKNLDSTKLNGAFDEMNIGEKKFNLHAKKEYDTLFAFLSINKKYINDSEVVYNKFIELANEIMRKKFQFIMLNNKSYYSLLSFKDDFVSNRDYNVDTLLHVYKKYLAPEFKSTFEAKQIRNVLNGRLQSLEGKMSPMFSARDISGKIINLESFKGKKYVLLNFWATWCGPCVAEIPTIDSINKKFINKDIVIISISEDRNEAKCIEAIQKLKMNWINIINDPNVEGLFGNNPALPQVFLIDKTGKIIYSRTDSKDPTLKKLLNIIEHL